MQSALPPQRATLRAPTRGGTRVKRSRKRWLIPIIGMGVVCTAIVVGLLVIYPRVGARVDLVIDPIYHRDGKAFTSWKFRLA